MPFAGRHQNFGMRRVLLTIRLPDSANNNTSECSCHGPSAHTPPAKRSPIASCQAATARTAVSTTLVNAGRNRRAFEISHLVGAGRQVLGRHVVARQPGHAAAYEAGQHQRIPAALQACGETKRGGADAERDHVAQRVELAAQRRVLLAPARHAAVKHVEEEGQRRHGRGPQKVRQRPASHVEHRQEDRGHAAGGICQRQKVSRMKIAQHREVALGQGVSWQWPVRPFEGTLGSHVGQR